MDRMANESTLSPSTKRGVWSLEHRQRITKARAFLSELGVRPPWNDLCLGPDPSCSSVERGCEVLTWFMFILNSEEMKWNHNKSYIHPFPATARVQKKWRKSRLIRPRPFSTGHVVLHAVFSIFFWVGPHLQSFFFSPPRFSTFISFTPLSSPSLPSVSHSPLPLSFPLSKRSS